MPATFVDVAHLWLQAYPEHACVGLVTFCLFSHIPQGSLLVWDKVQKSDGNQGVFIWNRVSFTGKLGIDARQVRDRDWIFLV